MNALCKTCRQRGHDALERNYCCRGNPCFNHEGACWQYDDAAGVVRPTYPSDHQLNCRLSNEDLHSAIAQTFNLFSRGDVDVEMRKETRHHYLALLQERERRARGYT